MFYGVYIIRPNGSCFCSISEKGNADESMVTSFFSALMIFATQEMGGTLKNITIEDPSGNERHIYFQFQKLNNGDKFAIAVIAPASTSKLHINERLVRARWAIRSACETYIHSNVLPRSVEATLKDELTKIMPLN